MAYPYRVVLSEEERAQLRGVVSSGVAPARTITRARIVLKANHGHGGPGWSDAAIAGTLDINPSTAFRVRRQFVQEGLAATLDRKRPDRVYERRLNGAREAHVIALACSVPPDGQEHWSLRLLADELVRLEVVEPISHETVRQTLKKTISNRVRHPDRRCDRSQALLRPRRCSPPSSSAAAKEDYQQMPPWGPGSTHIPQQSIWS